MNKGLRLRAKKRKKKERGVGRGPLRKEGMKQESVREKTAKEDVFCGGGKKVTTF